MDQQVRVFWAEGCPESCLLWSPLTFSLNLSCFSALSFYSSFNTLHVLTFPLPSCTQTLFLYHHYLKDTCNHTSASASLLHSGEDSPLSIPPLKRMSAMVPAFLLPAGATKTPSHSRIYQNVFFSLPMSLHDVLHLQPHFPLPLGMCTCDGTMGFFHSLI